MRVRALVSFVWCEGRGTAYVSGQEFTLPDGCLDWLKVGFVEPVGAGPAQLVVVEGGVGGAGGEPGTEDSEEPIHAGPSAPVPSPVPGLPAAPVRGADGKFLPKRRANGGG